MKTIIKQLSCENMNCPSSSSLLLVCMLMCFNLVSQNKIVYDFATKEFTDKTKTFNPKLSEGAENFTVKVKNVNNIKYKVIVEIDNVALPYSNEFDLQNLIPQSEVKAEDVQVPESNENLMPSKVNSNSENEIKASIESLNQILDKRNLFELYKFERDSYLAKKIINQDEFQSKLKSLMAILFDVNDISLLNHKLASKYALKEDYISLLNTLVTQVDAYSKQSIKDEKFYTAAIIARDKLQKEQANLAPLEITNIKKLFFEIINLFKHQFEVDVPGKIAGDRIDLTVKLKNSINEIETFGERSIEVINRFRINTTTGVQANWLFNGLKSYSCENNKIENNESHVALPYLTTSLLAYWKVDKALGIGGHFGVGFPISGVDNENLGIALNYGMSLIIGRKDRLVINVGGLLGKRDSHSYGDEATCVPETFETTSQFRGGYSVGLAWNLNVGK